MDTAVGPQDQHRNEEEAVRRQSEASRSIMELTRFIQDDMRDLREIWEIWEVPEKELIRLYLEDVHLDSEEIEMKGATPGMWRAYLLMVALELPSVNRLAGTMAARPDLVELCGLERTPSQPTLARFCRMLGENVADVEKSFQSITGMENWRAMPEDLRDLVRALDGVIMILGPTNDNMLDGKPVDRRLGPKMRELRLRTRVRRRLPGTAPEDPGNIDLVNRGWPTRP